MSRACTEIPLPTYFEVTEDGAGLEESEPPEMTFTEGSVDSVVGVALLVEEVVLSLRSCNLINRPDRMSLTLTFGSTGTLPL